VRRTILSFAGLVAVLGAAQAEECKNTEVFDHWGVVRLGDITPARMGKLAARTRYCDYKNDAACTYRDKSGITYAVVENYLESKEMVVADLPKGGTLPYHLSPLDTPASAAAKFRKRYGIMLTLFDGHDQHGTPVQVLADNCTYKGPDSLWLDIVFDSSARLLSVKTYVEGVRD
jgi:hypothetical protein